MSWVVVYHVHLFTKVKIFIENLIKFKKKTVDLTLTPKRPLWICEFTISEKTGGPHNIKIHFKHGRPVFNINKLGKSYLNRI